jgi:hypothetical protein
LLAVARRPLLTSGVLCLVSVSFAFALNPTSAALGHAVDRLGLGSHAPVFALYNIAYSLGMMGASALASACSGTLSLFWTLFCLSAVLLGSLPLLMAMEPKAAVQPSSCARDE